MVQPGGPGGGLQGKGLVSMFLVPASRIYTLSLQQHLEIWRVVEAWSVDTRCGCCHYQNTWRGETLEARGQLNFIEAQHCSGYDKSDCERSESNLDSARHYYISRYLHIAITIYIARHYYISRYLHIAITHSVLRLAKKHLGTATKSPGFCDHWAGPGEWSFCLDPRAGHSHTLLITPHT